MKNKTKKITIRSIPRKAQQLFDDSYYHILNDDEKAFLDAFHEGICRNNHRDHSLFTEHKNYSQIKSDLDRATNVRNKCFFFDSSHSLYIDGDAGEELLAEKIQSNLEDNQDEDYIWDFKTEEIKGDALKKLITNFSSKHGIGERIIIDLLKKSIRLFKLENKHKI